MKSTYIVRTQSVSNSEEVDGHDPVSLGLLADSLNVVDLLKADVLKVSHHGSKHGVNLELVERIAPKVTLISSVGGGGQFNFLKGSETSIRRPEAD